MDITQTIVVAAFLAAVMFGALLLALVAILNVLIAIREELKEISSVMSAHYYSVEDIKTRLPEKELPQ